MKKAVAEHQSSVGFKMAQEAHRENFFEKPDNTLAIYTASCVLKRIGEHYGLEGMDAYLNSYIRDVEGREPKLRAAVDQAVNLLNLENMYRKAINN